MKYFCDVCDKSNKKKNKSEPNQILTHNELGQCLQTDHTNENPDFLDVVEIFTPYITNDKKSWFYVSLNTILNWFLMQSFILILNLNNRIINQNQFKKV